MSKTIGKQIVGSPVVSLSDAPLISVPFTTVVNRAQIRDLTLDMAPRAGIERIHTPEIYSVTGEQGPNGERSWRTPNDLQDRIRFVGNWINQTGSGDGSYSQTSTVNDYVEIMFVGTGLHVLVMQRIQPANNDDYRASVDGGAEGSNILSSSAHDALRGKNRDSLTIRSIVSGLTYGVHTVKLRLAVGGMFIYGFDVINDISALRIQAGSLVSAQRRVSLGSTTDLAFKPATLTNGRGGRVITYSTGAGIAQATTSTNASLAYLASADHTNEEIVRAYHWREFGGSQTNDFSFAVGGNLNLAGTLEDGCSTLVGSNVTIDSQNQITFAANGSYIQLTFIGTGLDILRVDTSNASGTDTFSVTVDGLAAGSFSGTGSTVPRLQKIVSGLPYGTHVCRITRTAAPNTWDIQAVNWVVYQPKKPSIPTGSVEIADYCVLGDFAANATGSSTNYDGRMSTGVIRKQNSWDIMYNGTSWSYSSINQIMPNGFNLSTSNNGDYVEHIFWGTGFEYKFFHDSASGTATMSVDGSTNLSGFTTNMYGNNQAGGFGFTASTGAINFATSGGSNNFGGLTVTGLTLGRHVVRITKTGGTALNFNGLDVIQPIHSHVNSIPSDVQSTLPVGSCSLADRRVLNQDLNVSGQKYRGTAKGQSSSPTSTATAAVPMPDMSLVVPSKGAWFRMSFSGSLNLSSTGNNINISLRVNGLAAGADKVSSEPSAGYVVTMADSFLVYLGPGTHMLATYWYTNTGTLTANGLQRSFSVEEI